MKVSLPHLFLAVGLTLVVASASSPLRAQADPAGSPSPTPASEGPFTVLTGARLIDGTGKPPIEDAEIVVSGERIISAGPAGKVTSLPGAKTIDLKGKTIIPGLISAHSHLGQTKGDSIAPGANYTRENVMSQLTQYEAYGVTAVLSLGVNQDVLYTWRDEQRAGKFPGADIFTADRGLGVPRGAPPLPMPGDPVYRPTMPEEARAAVREMAARHPDILKIWVDDLFGSAPKMSPDIYDAAITEAHAAIDEAHRHGLRVAAHLFYLADAKALVKAGIDVIAHSVRDQPVDDELIQLLKTRRIPYIPTLALDEAQYAYADRPAWMDTPFFTNAVEPDLLKKWLSPEYAAKIHSDPKTPKNKAAAAVGQQNVKTLHDAGVTIAFGTDSGAMPTRIAGFSEHRELQLLVQSGLTPMDALICATQNSAAVLNDERNRGTLEPGKLADFLVLDANPLDDIRNTTRILTVWHRGNPVTPGR